VKAFERERLLERVDREGATVGGRIPAQVELEDGTFDLRDFVFEVKRRDELDADVREQVTEVVKSLRRARLSRRATIEAGEVPVETGERLADEILGIDRALTALGSLEPTDLEAEAAAHERADQERWLSFLGQVRGRDRGRRPRS